jgi:hypothetical protein
MSTRERFAHCSDGLDDFASPDAARFKILICVIGLSDQNADFDNFFTKIESPDS